MFVKYIGIAMKWDNFDNYNFIIKKKRILETFLRELLRGLQKEYLYS